MLPEVSTSSFLLGSLSSLVSAAFGYWTGGLRRAQENRKRRKAVATALLFELRPLERMLRTRAQHSHAAESTVTISMPVYDTLVGEILLFSPDSVHALLELRAYVRDIELSASMFTGKPQTIGNKAHAYVRAKAAMAANVIPKAKALLESEGGQPPVDWEVEQLLPGTELELGEPAFPNAARLEAGYSSPPPNER
jgi:hypothetical protein